MSDELFDTEEEVGGEEAAGGGRSVGFLPGLLIQVLKWAGIVVGAIIFIVTVVVVTLQVMGDTTQSQTVLPPDSPELSTERPAMLTYYQAIGEIRGVTADQPRRTFIIEPVLGYSQDNRQLQTELVQLTIPIREEIDFYFSERTADDLLGPESRRRVKEDLATRINRMLRSGEVEDVAFQQYQIVDF